MKPEDYGLTMTITGGDFREARTTTFAHLKSVLEKAGPGHYTLKHHYNGDRLGRFDYKSIFVNDIGTNRVITQSGRMLSSLVAVPKEDGTLATFDESLQSIESFIKEELIRVTELIRKTEEIKPRRSR